MLGETLVVRMTFTFHKPPLSAWKHLKLLHCKLSDIPKLVRSTADARSTPGYGGIRRNDARVVECHAAKRYPGEKADVLNAPGCVIQIQRIGM